MGCDVESNYVRKRLLAGFIYKDGDRWPMIQDLSTDGDHIGKPYSVPYSEVKPILRPLSSMTEEEAKEYNEIYYKIYGNSDLEGMVLCAAAVTNYLRSKHFDCDQLIESGLAIQKP